MSTNPMSSNKNGKVLMWRNSNLITSTNTCNKLDMTISYWRWKLLVVEWLVGPFGTLMFLALTMERWLMSSTTLYFKDREFDG